MGDCSSVGRTTSPELVDIFGSHDESEKCYEMVNKVQTMILTLEEW